MENGDGECVSLYYARAFDGEFYLLEALASKRCRANLRTSGWALLSDHPLPEEGFDPKWKYARFVGRFYPDEEGWGVRYQGTWGEWRGLG